MQLYDIICQGKYNTYWFELWKTETSKYDIEYQVIDKEDDKVLTCCETFDEAQSYFDDYLDQEWRELSHPCLEREQL